MLLLDTDICIEILRKNEMVLSKLANAGLMQKFLSPMTVFELYYGVYNSPRPDYQLKMTSGFINRLAVVPWSMEQGISFGLLKSFLRKEGKLIPDADLIIASAAIVGDLSLVTNNFRHFERLEKFGLKLEAWAN